VHLKLLQAGAALGFVSSYIHAADPLYEKAKSTFPKFCLHRQ